MKFTALHSYIIKKALRMGRPGITEQQIYDAIKQLRNTGQDVSTKKVREITGTGSNTTINKILKKLSENNPIQESTVTSQEKETKQREMLDEIIRLKAKIDVLTDAQDKTSKEADALKIEKARLDEELKKAQNLAEDLLNENKKLENVLATMYKFEKYEIVKIFINTSRLSKDTGYYLYDVLVLSFPKTKIDGIKKPVLCDFTADNLTAIFDEDSLERYEDRDPRPDNFKKDKYLKKPKGKRLHLSLNHSIFQ